MGAGAPWQSWPEERRQVAGLADPALRPRLDDLAALLRVDAAAVVSSSGGGGGGGGVEALVDACVRAVERFITPFWDHVEAASASTAGGGDTAGAAGTAASGIAGGRGGRGGGRGGGGGGGGKKASWNLNVSDFPSGVELGGPIGAGPAVEAGPLSAQPLPLDTAFIPTDRMFLSA